MSIGTTKGASGAPEAGVAPSGGAHLDIIVQTQTWPATEALARRIADKAPIALRYAKDAVVGGLGLPLLDGIRLENHLATLLRTTEDRVEGTKPFVEKWKPRRTGR